MTKVELVARAMNRAKSKRHYNLDDDCWNELPDYHRNEWLANAEAAITALEVADKAMRDTPTEAEIRAGAREIYARLHHLMRVGGREAQGSYERAAKAVLAMQAARSETHEHEWGRGEYGRKCLYCEATNPDLTPRRLRSEIPVQDDDAELRKALDEARDTLTLLRNDLAEENSELHAQRIAVIALTLFDTAIGKQSLDR